MRALAGAALLTAIASPAFGQSDMTSAPTKAGATVKPTTLLDQAISVLRRDHIGRNDADWERLIASAHATLSMQDDLTTARTAIRDVVAALGERHTMLLVRDEQPDGPTPPPARPFTAEMRSNGIGYVVVPAFNGSPDKGDAYAIRLRDGLAELVERRACGIIVDLRGNTGGNVWPMLNGIGPLIGRDLLFTFDIAGQGLFPVRWRDGQALQDGAPANPKLSAPMNPKLGHLPVALLTDEWTASAGESAAIAFIDRPLSRRFGVGSAGYVTVNNTAGLPDGSTLLVTMGWHRDAAGRRITSALQPDVVTLEPEAAAMQWLSRQNGCR